MANYETAVCATLVAYFLEKYSSGRRGAPAKGVGRATGAEVQIFSSPPKMQRYIFVSLHFSFLSEKDLSFNVSVARRGSSFNSRTLWVMKGIGTVGSRRWIRPRSDWGKNEAVTTTVRPKLITLSIKLEKFASCGGWKKAEMWAGFQEHKQNSFCAVRLAKANRSPIRRKSSLLRQERPKSN